MTVVADQAVRSTADLATCAARRRPHRLRGWRNLHSLLYTHSRKQRARASQGRRRSRRACGRWSPGRVL